MLRKADYKNEMVLLIAIVVSFFAFNVFRMTFFQLIHNNIFRFFSTYLGTAILSFFSIVLIAFLKKKRPTKFEWSLLFFLVMTSLYDFISAQAFTFSEFKAVIVYNKLNQGIFIAISMLLIWNLVYSQRDGESKVRIIFSLIFYIGIIINALMIGLYVFGTIEVTDHSNLNNNRCTLELFTICTVIFLLPTAKRSSWLKNLKFYNFFFIILLAIIYSSRLVLLGCILVLLFTLVTTFKKHVFERQRITTLLLILSLLGLLDANLNSSREIIKQYAKLNQARSSYIDNSKRIIKIRNIRLDSLNGNKETIVESLININNIPVNDGRLVLTLNQISTISRVSNMIGAAKAFIERPTGWGVNKAKERKSLEHSNHSVFFRNLEAYGIFFLAYALVLFFFVSPTKNLVVWVPLIISCFFNSNLLWCSLLPFIGRYE